LSHYWIQPLLLIGNLSSVGATSRSRPGGRSYKKSSANDTLFIRNGI